MIILLQPGCSEEEEHRLLAGLAAAGLRPHRVQGTRPVLVLDTEACPQLAHQLAQWPAVDRIIPLTTPFKLSSNMFRPQKTLVKVGSISIGASEIVIIAGPCAVESAAQLTSTALAVKEAGAHALRGGAFKPRTSPYSFQGLGEEGLRLLAEAGEATGLPVVTEVLDPRHVSLVSTYADVLQIGARNMQNFQLLREVGKAGKPVILKRNPAATVEEWLMAADYILDTGNDQVILCERGIRTFEPSTRNTVDISSVAVVRELSHLPVIVDPSHGAGRATLVPAIARAAIAAGADGVLVEVHINPPQALCDGPQSLTPIEFRRLVGELRAIAAALGRADAITRCS